MLVRILVCFALALIGAAGPAWSQSYPTKPIRLIVGYAPGGSVDTTARIFAPRLSAELGQQVIVENRPGAASNIAGEYVARSAPDGYTLFWSSGPALGTNMAFYEKMTYNPLKDFTPIALLVYQSNGLVVNPTVPAKTTKELIALAKARPGQLNYGSAGSGVVPAHDGRALQQDGGRQDDGRRLQRRRARARRPDRRPDRSRVLAASGSDSLHPGEAAASDCRIGRKTLAGAAGRADRR